MHHTTVKELQEYNLSLKSLQIGTYNYEYSLDDSFFEKIDAPDIRRGEVDATVKVEKGAHNIEIKFHLKGKIITICDRCLDDLEIDIDTNEHIFIKFGKEYAEESDELIVISEDEGVYNIAWIMYEFIVLSIPIARLHNDGECNEEMMNLYAKYIVDDVDEDEDAEEVGEKDEDDKKEVDPRWAALKNIFDNN